MPLCPACGKEYLEGMNYCPECGYELFEKATIETSRDFDYPRYYVEPPDLWHWYFCKHPRVLVLVPVFLIFVCFGLIYGLRAITDIIYFFQIHTWGAVGVFLILGGIMVPVVFVPSIIAFGSIYWLHATYTEVKNSWAKLGLTVFLIFILPILGNLLRYVFLLIMGISEKYSYTVLPYW